MKEQQFKGTKGKWTISNRSSTAIECDGRVICSTGGYSDNSRSEEVYYENQANANLVSSAPELLESLQELRRFICNLPINDETNELAEKSRLAIKKALGE